MPRMRTAALGGEDPGVARRARRLGGLRASGAERSSSLARVRIGTPALLLVALSFMIAGCGGGERDFTASEFIDEANAHGAGLVLGEELYDPQPGVDVHGISFEGDVPGSAAGGKEIENGASLTVSDDADAALEAYNQCQATGSFICYRAANATLVLGGDTSPADVSRVTAAVKALQTN